MTGSLTVGTSINPLPAPTSASARRQDFFDGYVVIGAGPVGLAVGAMLRRRGKRVLVLERRGSVEVADSDEPSFNVTLVPRSMALLKQIGAPVDDLSVTIRARQVWGARGSSVHPYGLRETDRLHSIPRRVLVERLREQNRVLGVELRTGVSLVRLDARRGQLLLETAGGRVARIASDHIIVADGANSRGREDLARQADCRTHREPDGFCYATVVIDAGAAAQAGLEPDRIHFVPGPGGIDIGIANRDGSFSVLIKRPDQPDGFSIRSSADARRFVDGSPPLLRRHIDGLVDQLIASPLRRFKYAGSEKWAFGRAALVGDSARCMPPYLGQGLNAGLHDVASLTSAFDATGGDWDQSLTCYQVDREHHARQLELLARAHGRTLLTGRLGSAQWKFRNRAERLAEFLFGYRNLYQRLVFDVQFSCVRTPSAAVDVAGLPPQVTF